MKKLSCFLILFIFISCGEMDMNHSENDEQYYKKMCKSQIEIIFPNGEIDTILPKGIHKFILFDEKKKHKHYVVSDSINITLKNKICGRFYYILNYNTLHHTERYLAYVNGDYGLWLGARDSIPSLGKLNKVFSGSDIVLIDSSEAFDFAMLLLRLSNDGGLDRLCIGNIQDVWILSQFYNDKIEYLNIIDKLAGNFIHLNILNIKDKVHFKPEKFPEYNEVTSRLIDMVKKPSVTVVDSKYVLEFFVWDQYTGNLERWNMKIKMDGKVKELNIKLIEERIGYFRGSKLGILTIPE